MAVSAIALRFHRIPSNKFLPNNRNFKVQAEKAAAAASFVTEKQKMESLKDDGLHGKIGSSVASLLALIRRAPREILKPPDTRSWPLLAEIAVEQTIISCRFFTLIAVVGSLVGSILCFVEGCFLMLESYIEDFHIVSHSLDHGRMVHMVIEAIDMFLVGTAMLSFGMGLYSMFIGFKRTNGWLVHGSKLKMFSACSKTSSISQTKSRIGTAVVMLLQVGVLEKFKSVPLATGLDLACFAGALFFSSASMFLLSRLYCSSEEEGLRESQLNKAHKL